MSFAEVVAGSDESITKTPRKCESGRKQAASWKPKYEYSADSAARPRLAKAADSVQGKPGTLSVTL